ncbi:hypothetical protein FRAAL3636 [Frankia alni ACN14a]|uniref:Uncharacterized protein n=1 Tax=Frankia alni (strain DSM 45986 / CECT 9034 / ACN14a) TaxID=326424 RepID=Q0RJN3_FRAAA|nr:hypothetical protein FRAAL3636 [Frankia alni ACN14a]
MVAGCDAAGPLSGVQEGIRDALTPQLRVAAAVFAPGRLADAALRNVATPTPTPTLDPNPDSPIPNST